MVELRSWSKLGVVEVSLRWTNELGGLIVLEVVQLFQVIQVTFIQLGFKIIFQIIGRGRDGRLTGSFDRHPGRLIVKRSLGTEA